MGSTDVLTPEQIEIIKQRTSEGRLDCAEAFRLAEEFSLTVGQIGKACDDLGIRIRNCQLGCF